MNWFAVFFTLYLVGAYFFHETFGKLIFKDKVERMFAAILLWWFFVVLEISFCIYFKTQELISDWRESK